MRILSLAALALVAAPASAQILEDFEHNNPALWTNASGAGVVITTASAHDGMYGANPNNSSWDYRTDKMTAPGDTIRWFVRFNGSSGRTYCGVAASASGCFSAVLATNTSNIILQENSGYSYLDLGSAPVTWTAGLWYTMELDWAMNGDMTVTLYDEAGTTMIATTGPIPTSATAGGIAMRGFGHNGDLDTIDGSGGAVINTYCTAKINSLGCTPAISGTGVPSASMTSGFTVDVAMVRNQKSGLFFYKANGSQAKLRVPVRHAVRRPGRDQAHAGPERGRQRAAGQRLLRRLLPRHERLRGGHGRRQPGPGPRGHGHHGALPDLGTGPGLRRAVQHDAFRRPRVRRQHVARRSRPKHDAGRAGPPGGPARPAPHSESAGRSRARRGRAPEDPPTPESRTRALPQETSMRRFALAAAAFALVAAPASAQVLEDFEHQNVGLWTTFSGRLVRHQQASSPPTTACTERRGRGHRSRLGLPHRQDDGPRRHDTAAFFKLDVRHQRPHSTSASASSAAGAFSAWSPRPEHERR